MPRRKRERVIVRVLVNPDFFSGFLAGRESRLRREQVWNGMADKIREKLDIKPKYSEKPFDLIVEVERWYPPYCLDKVVDWKVIVMNEEGGWAMTLSKDQYGYAEFSNRRHFVSHYMYMAPLKKITRTLVVRALLEAVWRAEGGRRCMTQGIG